MPRYLVIKLSICYSLHISLCSRCLTCRSQTIGVKSQKVVLQYTPNLPEGVTSGLSSSKEVGWLLEKDDPIQVFANEQT